MTNKNSITPAATCLVLAAMSMAGASAGDLSKYRDIRFGTDLATVSKQVAIDPSQATTIHSRPALLQDLSWRPQLVRASSKTEPVKEVIFSFYDGALYRIAVEYDRFQTAGMTVADMVEAISANYGAASKPNGQTDVAPALYGEQQEVLAEWQDADYRFDLIRGSYGPSFRLVGMLKKLEAPVQTATVEAARLDVLEAPQREAARAAKASEAEKILLEQSRLANKPKFRP